MTGFDAVPTVAEPTAEQRAHARRVFPPAYVPDDGPVPAPRYAARQPVQLTAPAWALEATRWRLEHVDTPDRFTAEAILQEYVTPAIAFVDENGDPVDAGTLGVRPAGGGRDG